MRKYCVHRLYIYMEKEIDNKGKPCKNMLRAKEPTDLYLLALF